MGELKLQITQVRSSQGSKATGMGEALSYKASVLKRDLRLEGVGSHSLLNDVIVFLFPVGQVRLLDVTRGAAETSGNSGC